MLTKLGRFLRKLRIDNDEILKDMADKIGVTSSFLSAVENGKKRMPTEWIHLICQIYSLNNEQQSEFTNAVADTEKYIGINLQGASVESRKLAVSFARQFNDFDETQIEEINKIMQGGKSN
ncbi:MAG: helix-turn-helix domain-containing protein [Clostridia bacterium]|nr:helix-turn-helix domain-containing protein [Clostridia bacterium]